MTNHLTPLASEYEQLIKELNELQNEVVRLTTLRDDLVYRVCPSLRAIYEKEIGPLERELLSAQMHLQEKQLILELLRAQKNRQEDMSYQKAEQQAKEERRAYEEDLNRRAKEAEEFQDHWQNKTQWSSVGDDIEEGVFEADGAGDAGDTSAGVQGDGIEEGVFNGDSGVNEPDEEAADENLTIAQRIKRLYRKIMKRLHPDVNPNISQRDRDLLNEAQRAYDAADLETLERIWDEIAGDDVEAETYEDTAEDIAKLKERIEKLRARREALLREISSIRGEFPYTMKEMLQNEELLQAKREEMQNLLQEARDAMAQLEELIAKIREELNQ